LRKRKETNAQLTVNDKCAHTCKRVTCVAHIEHDRWVNAAQRVSAIERSSKSLKPRLFPRKFQYAQRSAWASEVGYSTLPADQQPEPPFHGELRTRLRAESMLIGKFDVDAEVR